MSDKLARELSIIVKGTEELKAPRHSVKPAYRVAKHHVVVGTSRKLRSNFKFSGDFSSVARHRHSIIRQPIKAQSSESGHKTVPATQAPSSTFQRVFRSAKGKLWPTKGEKTR